MYITQLLYLLTLCLAFFVNRRFQGIMILKPCVWISYALLCAFMLKSIRKRESALGALIFLSFLCWDNEPPIPAFTPIFTASDPFPSPQIPAATQISLSRSTNLLKSHGTWKPQISQDCVAAGRPVEPSVAPGCQWWARSLHMNEDSSSCLSVHAISYKMKVEPQRHAHPWRIG